MKDLFLFLHSDSREGLVTVVISKSFVEAMKTFKASNIDISGYKPVSSNLWTKDGDPFSYPYLSREEVVLNQVYVI